MANPEHLEILKQGVEAWNRWMQESSQQSFDLTNVDLAGVNLRGVFFLNGNLSGANLRDADLTGARVIMIKANCADLHKAKFLNATLVESQLKRVNLSEANLVACNLEECVLTEANLKRACLVRANLALAWLDDADLSEADLQRTNLTYARLRGANLEQVVLGNTVFGNTDLSNAKGLSKCQHHGASIIDHQTIFRSGRLPLVFLRGCGLPEVLIDYLPSLLREAIQFFSVFISYSSSNHDFAERLYADLQNKGVRCWFAPEDLKIGDKFRQQIDESIRLHDKLLLILSEHSIASPWVEEEVESALERERKENRLVLFPIRIDDGVMDSNQAWAASLRRMRHIGDFSRWKDHDSYTKAFERLLRDLKDEGKAGS